MFRYVTGVFIALNTFSSTFILDGYGVRYVSFLIGSVSLSHAPPEFHCPPLQNSSESVRFRSFQTSISAFACTCEIKEFTFFVCFWRLHFRLTKECCLKCLRLCVHLEKMHTEHKCKRKRKETIETFHSVQRRSSIYLKWDAE